MPDDTSMTLDLDPELRRQLIAEAAAQDSTVAAFLTKPLRDHVARKAQSQNYDAWLDAEIEQALSEANDPLVKRIPDGVVRTNLARRMASLQNKV